MDDLAVRPAQINDCYALARLVVNGNESSFRGRVPDACLDGLPVEMSARNWRRNFVDDETIRSGEHLLVAEIGTDVIGVAMAGRETTQVTSDRAIAERYPRDLSVLHVDPAWHRRGVGRTLVANVATRLLDEGVTGLLVRVLVDNPNAVAYERMGAVLVATQPYDWEGYLTEELLYGWDDLVRLGEHA